GSASADGLYQLRDGDWAISVLAEIGEMLGEPVWGKREGPVRRRRVRRDAVIQQNWNRDIDHSSSLSLNRRKYLRDRVQSTGRVGRLRRGAPVVNDPSRPRQRCGSLASSPSLQIGKRPTKHSLELEFVQLFWVA